MVNLADEIQRRLDAIRVNKAVHDRDRVDCIIMMVVVVTLVDTVVLRKLNGVSCNQG
jgi:hypothetical protein